MIILRYVAHLLGALLAIAALLAFQQFIDYPAWVGWLLLAALAAAWWRLRRTLWMPATGLALALIALGWLLSMTPRNDRDWWTEVSVLPDFSITQETVRIEGLRTFAWNEDGSFEPRWESRSYRLDELDELELVVEPLRDSTLMAHTMLCFGFNGERVMVSVEARKEKHENYGLLPGALRQFELIYVFGDERDLLGTRALCRKAHLYLYPVRATPQFIRDLFLELVTAAAALHDQPRFYRSIYDNCTTTLVKHVDRHMQRPFGLRKETLCPGLTGKLIHTCGYMDTELGYEAARAHYRVDARVLQHLDAPDFSARIRAK